MPPALLISATTICAVFLSGSPKNEGGPVIENRAPIFIGEAAIADTVESTIDSIMNIMRENRAFINPPVK
jgi:hypothetical protein